MANLRRAALVLAAAVAGCGAKACTGAQENRTSLRPVTPLTPPQVLLIVSLTYWAMTPPRLTVVLAT